MMEWQAGDESHSPYADADGHFPAEFAHATETGEPVLLSTIEKSAQLIGRAVFGGFFVYNGIKHFVNADMMSTYAASKGVPAAKTAVIASGALIALGGLSVLTGVKPKIGAGMIAAFLVGVTPQMHDFWHRPDPQSKANEQAHFLKNLALLGGAALAAAVPQARVANLEQEFGV
jgi:uncharacterized membrane protein YphA (DoxX/SURF4 family)